MLKIEHLTKRFGGETKLDDINLEVKRGEVYCIIGQSGGGKSLILKHIIGLLIPDGGRISLDDEEISTPESKSSDFTRIRRKLGMLFQGAALFDSMTIGENIAFPLREHTKIPEDQIRHITAEALAMVNLHNIEDQMPAQLSGGMRSRVGLARALVMKPELMLYDEPTSALDPIMADKINDLISDLRNKLNMTSIVVTHDIASAAKIADRIAMIHQGKIIFEGSPAEIRSSRNPYIQQFIRGQRRIQTVLDMKNDDAHPPDLDQIRTRISVDRRLRQHPSGNPRVFDEQTGLVSMVTFNRAIEEEVSRLRQCSDAMAVVMCSIDSYDNLRVELGEQFVGTVVQDVAQRLQDTVRGTDMASRFAPDTIAIMLTKFDHHMIVRGVDRIRQHVTEGVFPTRGGQSFSATVSCGVALYGRHGADGPALLNAAKAALDKAKAAGGNRVVSA